MIFVFVGVVILAVEIPIVAEAQRIPTIMS